MSKYATSDIEIPLEVDNEHHKERNVQIVRHKRPAETKPKGGEENQLSREFIAPNGGWGWMVATAAGISLLTSFPILQQFGILFRQRFTDFGWSSSQIVTLINAQQAASAIIGIFSGALYRTFSYRQVSFMGAILVFLGLIATFFSKTYISYFSSITFLYGFGKGFICSASIHAVNSYFDTKRKSAMTLMTTIAGLGPMFLPFVSTFLMIHYGVTGAVLFYVGFSLHNFVCSYIYQPVQKHAKKVRGERLAENLRSLQIETPLIGQENEKLKGSQLAPIDLKDLAEKNSSNNENIDNTTPANLTSATPTYTLILTNNNPNRSSKNIEFSPEEMECLKKPPREEFLRDFDHQPNKPSVLSRIVNFLHLDLLQDFTYFNLALGLTVIEFTENNFASVLPFILTEFGLTNIELAMCMSILGTCDMIMKFLIPYTVAKLKCDKRVIMIISCMLICSARVVVGQSRKVPIALVCFGVMGTNKAIRVAYGNMILPGYVTPKRLSDAIALERTIMGVFSLLSAPVIGLIPDATSYGFFVLSMNGMCVIVALLWFGEDLVRWCVRKLKTSKPEEASKAPVEI